MAVSGHLQDFTEDVNCAFEFLLKLTPLLDKADQRSKYELPARPLTLPEGVLGFSTALLSPRSLPLAGAGGHSPVVPSA